MKIKSEELINQLIELSTQNSNKVKQLLQLSETNLNSRLHTDSWSILEVIEHLNLYGHFYIPEITGRLKENTSQADLYFNSGLLGNYFAKSMLPKEKLNKMKTFKDKDPIGSQLNKEVLTEFLDQQNQMIALLERARNLSLNKTKCAITISKWIKLKLGDTFRFIIYHHQRHIVQIEKILKNKKNSPK